MHNVVWGCAEILPWFVLVGTVVSFWLLWWFRFGRYGGFVSVVTVVSFRSLRWFRFGSFARFGGFVSLFRVLVHAVWRGYTIM